MADYRSERSASPDGAGNAKRGWAKAWDSYLSRVRPVTDRLRPVFRPLAEVKTLELLGFWLAWHTCGGFEGLQKNLGMSRSGVYRRVSAFRTAFGQHPDSFQFPGVTIDLEGGDEGVRRFVGRRRFLVLGLETTAA